ncbi:MAG TPA: HAMP domain-containing sensor histidine kinase, partial [Flavobacteriales bacterium]|nr:HAMP domain-containing sensor histidine kinase [Flavobacteriales bacterium]
SARQDSKPLRTHSLLTLSHMTDRSHRRTLLLFGALAVYIVLQFIWWGVLLLRKDRELALLNMEVTALSGGGAGAPARPGHEVLMVVGEGSVFLLLLLGVMFFTLRAIRRDLALARAQHNFLLAVTHELRTPIAAIKLQLQTLARPELDASQRDALREQALTESDRLALLTDKVLLATRAEDGVLALERKELDVMELLRTVVHRARAQLAQSHSLVLNGPGHLVAHSDAQALHSIVDNLIENAAKYTPSGTTITVDVLKGKEGWRLTVADEGPGVPQAEQDRIFERFYRGGSEETRSTTGTGLGLYIVHRLVHRLGGAVHVRSRSPHGAIFAASFPDR